MLNDVEQKVKSVIAEVLEIPPEKLSDERQFHQALLTVESVAMLEILVILERQYQIHILENEIQGLREWRQLVDLIRKKIATRSATATEQDAG